MRILRLIAFSIALLCTSILVSANTEPSSLEEQINQQLTHSLYSLVITNAGLEIKTEYRPHALSRWVYLQSFLKEWDKRINEAKYSNSLEIFDSIAADKSYVLGRHYIYWKTLHDGASREHQTPLGKANNDFLGFVLQSEREEILDQRILRIIDGINRYLIANSQEYKLANLLLEIFKQSNNFEIRAFASQIQKQIPGYKNMETARLVGSILLGGLGLKQLSGAKIPQLPNNIKGLRAEKIKEKVKSLFQLGKSTMNSMNQHIALAKSIGLHTGILYYLASSETGSAENANTSSAQIGAKDSLVLAIRLKFIAKSLSEKLFTSELPSSVLKEETTLYTDDEILGFIEDTYNRVLGENEAPIMDMMISLEHNSGFYPNELAKDIVHNKIQFHQTEVRKLAADGTLDEEDIEKIRFLLINGVLSEYKRDYPNFVGTMLDWGGNCVAQTMLFTALLYPYQRELANANLRLGIFLDSDHIETFIYNKSTKTYHEMVAGGLYTSTPQRTMYKPNFLLALMARNFETDFDWPVNELGFHGPFKQPDISEVQSTELWQTLKNFGKKLVSVGSSFSIGDSIGERFGALDTIRRNDLEARFLTDETSSFNEIPYSAKISYTAHKTPSHNGAAGAISEVDSSSNINNYFIETDLDNILNEIVSETNSASGSKLEISYKKPTQESQFKKFEIQQINDTFKLRLFSHDDYYQILNLQYQNNIFAIMEKINNIVYLEDDWAQSSLSYQNIFNVEKRSPIQLSWREEDFLWLKTNLGELDEKFSATSKRNHTIHSLLEYLSGGDIKRDHETIKFRISRGLLRDQHIDNISFLIEEFTKDPSLFVLLYQQLKKNGRNFLLSNFVTPLEMQKYYPFLGSGYLSKFISSNEQLTNFRHALSDYMKQLNKDSVIVTPPQEAVNGMCWRGPKINLPKADLGWTFRGNDRDCDEHYSDSESQEKIELSAPGDSLPISADSLVELSLATGKGFQVWDETAMQTVQSGNFIESSYLDVRLTLDSLFEDILNNYPDTKNAKKLIAALKDQSKELIVKTSDQMLLISLGGSFYMSFYKLRFNHQGNLISKIFVIYLSDQPQIEMIIEPKELFKQSWCVAYKGPEKIICSMHDDPTIKIKLENGELKSSK
ncbi:MAG: hypothetical protein VX583_02435 [Bdellovibrionota bacterium]|nr:hypothetical protein [Pseudobdellovibrionaceae bacterium]|tara:strand:- start:96564 stop:99938 length:3375 start_codon:yes stop_codon:yes gene_type:complete